MINEIEGLKRIHHSTIPMGHRKSFNYGKIQRYNEAITDVIKILNKHFVVGRSEQLFCDCSQAKGVELDEDGMPYCISCQKNIAAK